MYQTSAATETMLAMNMIASITFAPTVYFFFTFTPAYPLKLLITLISKRIVDLELFDVPPATRFLWINRYPDDAKRVLVCCDFCFHPAVVSPEAFHLVKFHLTSGEHHCEIRRVERVISQPQLDAFEPIPGYFPDILA